MARKKLIYHVTGTYLVAGIYSSVSRIILLWCHVTRK